LTVVWAAALATPSCSLISLDGLTGAAVGPDANDDQTPEAEPEAAPPLPSPYAQLVLSDMPLAYYRLDEASGSTVHDLSGNGNDATYVGGVTPGAPGAVAGDPDTAATFDGSTGYIDAGNIFAFPGNDPFSLEAWVRAASSPNNGGIFSREDNQGGPPSEGYVAFVSNDEGVFGFQRLDGANQTLLSSNSMGSAARYIHIVAVYDGAAMLLYVNGAAETMQTAAFAIAGAMNHFVVGTEAGGAEDFFQGQLDEVAIYGHALTASRVSAHYNKGIGKGG
jgi:hypothetical protein